VVCNALDYAILEWKQEVSGTYQPIQAGSLP
jgi:hypothetical protein